MGHRRRRILVSAIAARAPVGELRRVLMALCRSSQSELCTAREGILAQIHEAADSGSMHAPKRTRRGLASGRSPVRATAFRQEPSVISWRVSFQKTGHSEMFRPLGVRHPASWASRPLPCREELVSGADLGPFSRQRHTGEPG